MKKVLVFGTFDVIHPGHISFLQQAAEMGDYLIASVARDSFVAKVKGKLPLHSEDDRLNYLIERDLVDEAYLSDEILGTYSLIDRLNPDIVCFGHDQIELRENFRAWKDSHQIILETVTLKPYRPEKYKSSKLNNRTI